MSESTRINELPLETLEYLKRLLDKVVPNDLTIDLTYVIGSAIRDVKFDENELNF